MHTEVCKISKAWYSLRYLAGKASSPTHIRKNVTERNVRPASNENAANLVHLRSSYVRLYRFFHCHHSFFLFASPAKLSNTNRSSSLERTKTWAREPMSPACVTCIKHKRLAKNRDDRKTIGISGDERACIGDWKAPRARALLARNNDCFSFCAI